MLKALVASAFLVLGFSQAGAWSHGMPPAAASCNVVTGISTGVGAGTCIAAPAVCDGSANVNSAFTAFNTWALALQTANPSLVAANALLIELEIPLGKTCAFTGGGFGNTFASGVKQFRLNGNGSTITNNTTGNGFFLGPISNFINTVTGYANVQTVAAGATTLTLVNAGDASKFTIGDWTIITGVDLQGGGDPPNPAFWEWIKIVAINGSVLTLSAPLARGYKSTWPLYNSGSGVTTYQGGPATLYQINQAWDSDAVYWNVRIDQSGQTYAKIRNVAFYDVTIPSTGASCIIPTVNKSWEVYDSNLSLCVIETDKMIDQVVMRKTTLKSMNTQSPSIKRLTLDQMTITDHISGTARDLATIAGSTIASFSAGTQFYGGAGEVQVSNASLASVGIVGASQSNVGARGTWANGVLTVPPSMVISSAANNGSGLIRLTVDDTSKWSTGLVGDGPGGACTGSYAVTVIDATHVDLQGSTFTGTCTGKFGSVPMPWAVPGYNIYWGSGNNAAEGPIFQVTDLEQTANGTVVTTTLAGGVPTMPPGGGAAVTAKVHSAPKFSCVNCTGSLDAVDLSNAGAQGVPLGSYSKRTFTASNCTTSNPAIPSWGALSSINVAVNSASNAGGTMQVNLGNVPFGPFVITLNSTTKVFYNPIVNAKITGTRTITPTTASGAQSGDTLTTPGSDAWFSTNQMNPGCSSTPGGGDPISFDLEVITNQGVVYP